MATKDVTPSAPTAKTPKPKKKPTPEKTPVKDTPKPVATNTPKVQLTPTPTIMQGKRILPKIGYKYAGKETLMDSIRKAIPKPLIPTKRFGMIFGWVFLGVLIIAAIQFPFSEFLKGNMEITIDIGYPLPFLQLELIESETSPLRIGSLFIDLTLYILLSYVIDVIISLIMSSAIIRSKEDSKKIPIVFRDKKITAAEVVAKKVSK